MNTNSYKDFNSSWLLYLYPFLISGVIFMIFFLYCLDAGILLLPENNRGFLEDAPFLSYFFYIPLLYIASQKLFYLGNKLLISLVEDKGLVFPAESKIRKMVDERLNNAKEVSCLAIVIGRERANRMHIVLRVLSVFLCMLFSIFIIIKVLIQHIYVSYMKKDSLKDGKNEISLFRRLCIISWCLLLPLIAVVSSYYSHLHPVEQYGFNIWSSGDFPILLITRAVIEVLGYYFCFNFVFKFLKICKVAKGFIKDLIGHGADKSHRGMKIDIAYQVATVNFYDDYLINSFKYMLMIFPFLIILGAYFMFYPFTPQLFVGVIGFAGIFISAFLYITFPLQLLLQHGVENYWENFQDIKSAQPDTSTSVIQQETSVANFLSSVPAHPYSLKIMSYMASSLFFIGTVGLGPLKWLISWLTLGL